MSGGRFDYVQYRIRQAADEVSALIGQCEDKESRPDCLWNYAPEIVDKFRECEKALNRAASMLHRVDWLVSGDDSEETFSKLWEALDGQIER